MFVLSQSALHTFSSYHVSLSPANQCSIHPPILMSVYLRPISAPCLSYLTSVYLRPISALHMLIFSCLSPIHMSVCLRPISAPHNLLFSCLFVSGQSLLHTSSYSHVCLSPANQCSIHPPILMSVCLRPISAPHVFLLSYLFFSN